MRLRRLLVIPVSLALAATAALPVTALGSPDGAGALRWIADTTPFRLSIHKGHQPILEQTSDELAGPGGRMAYALADGSTHRLTDLVRTERARDGARYVVATDEPDRTATVVVSRTPRGLRVSWSLQPATDVTQVYESLTGNDAEHFLGGGANFLYTDLRHRMLLNKAYFTGAGSLNSCNKSGMPSPFFLSSQGYAVFPETDAVGRLAFPNAVDDQHCTSSPPPCPVLPGQPDRTQLCFKTNRLDYEVYAGSPAEVVRAYSARAGLPTMPPVRQFALTHWRDTVDGQATVIDDVSQLLRRGIPLGTEWIDNPWEISTKLPGESQNSRYSCNGTLTFDPVQFPDPPAMVAALKAQGVDLGLWLSPHVREKAAERPCPPTDFPEGSFIQTGRTTDPLQLDLTNPATYDHFQDKLRQLFSLGITMVKGDRGEEFELEDATFAAGPGTELMNTNPVRYAQATTEVLEELYGDQYTTLWRGGYTGLPAIVNGVWGGDPRATYDGLRLSVRRGMNSWLSGHPMWGTDTGGFNGGGAGAPSSTLLTRWSQFSAVSPVFEVGGAGRNATPWLYDDATVARFRDNVLLHYALFPYLYGLARRAARTGEPITRPMAFDYPGDEQAWTADQHMMVGPDLLAVPVTADRNETDAAAGQPTPVDVYLPRGRWIDLYTGSVLDGGKHIVRESTVDDFPLYLRAGAAIGFNQRIDGVWPEPWGLNDLDRRDRAGWTYAPGTGTTVATNPFGGKLKAHSGDGKIHLTVTGAPAETQVMVAVSGMPRKVVIDDRSVRQSLDGKVGWTTRPAPFGGVLIKLNPRHGTSTVTITL
jgi:alpha-D-xyloside xylohydrolase